MLKNIILGFLILWAFSSWSSPLSEDSSEIAYESSLEQHFAIIDDSLTSKSNRTKNDIHSTIDLHTSVKSQKSRGTCTMFTAVGIIEHLLIRDGLFKASQVDFSEEWMEYIIMKDKQSEGSSTSRNLKAVKKYGVINESTWPYLGKRWRALSDFPIAQETCGHLVEMPMYLESCLLGHRDPRLYSMSDDQLSLVDPEFLKFKKEADLLKYKYINELYKKRKSYKMKKVSTVKSLLNQGKSVIMGTKLYYGSWNSIKTTKLEIQQRDKDKWYRGIVTYPEHDSVDRRISGEKGGGHSVILVGYDDDVVVKSRMLMEDGSWKEFSYKGVYYFKNSWGVRGFGKRFELDGVKYPGYGMITQKYAHEFGSFFNIH